MSPFTYNRLTRIIVLALLAFQSCGPSEIDIESVNYYIINNQSSYDLFYETGTGLDERTIFIDRFDEGIIEEGRVYASTEPLSANDFFVDAPDIEFVLLREFDGEIIQALQLNSGEIFEWQTVTSGTYTYNHTLIVTDDMLY